ncbi:transketolase [Pseudonocardia sp. TRM90224]|uniref:transketolase n=1 Tax=Pseudonocardia sp. TRM90224 TaxID=2812678 RepID=UPI001E538B29|nr:1-deoxy-D-xylulose-5-phosphate synthase N-terminal domain-containing protein [Pseudonocardia sp. TRM90224]
MRPIDVAPELDERRDMTVEDIARLANRCRQVLLEMIYRAGSGHVGSSLSCIDLLSALRFDQMRWAAGRSRTGSDVFVLSKGHAVPAWYAALIVAGDLSPEWIGRLRRIDSPLQGHPDRTRCELVDVSTGALGQGLSVAIGRAVAKRLKGEDSHVYCLVGDGECQEGQVWEALMHAGARGLPGVTLLVDHNGSQNDGPVEHVLPSGSLPAKLQAFGWQVQEIDGHEHHAIRAALGAARRSPRPTALIAHTRKGHLGGDRVVLGGSHSGVLTREEFHAATDYLDAVAVEAAS